MDRFLNVLTFFSIGIIILVLVSVRRSHIRVEYSVSWLGAALTILALSRSKTVADQLASLVGIDSAPLAIMLVAMSLFLIVFYRFSVIISDLKDANVALAQKVAILEYRIEAMGERNEETEAAGA